MFRLAEVEPAHPQPSFLAKRFGQLPNDRELSNRLLCPPQTVGVSKCSRLTHQTVALHSGPQLEGDWPYVPFPRSHRFPGSWPPEHSPKAYDEIKTLSSSSCSKLGSCIGLSFSRLANKVVLKSHSTTEYGQRSASRKRNALPGWSLEHVSFVLYKASLLLK